MKQRVKEKKKPKETLEIEQKKTLPKEILKKWGAIQ